MSLLTATRDYRSNANLRRLKKLDHTLDGLSEGIAFERESLRSLLDRLSANIAFSFEVMENGETSTRLSNKVSTLETSLALHSKRLSQLNEQAALVAKVKADLCLLVEAQAGKNSSVTF